MSSVHSDVAATADAGANEAPEQNAAPIANAPAAAEANGQPDTSAHLVAFFANYPEFTYDTTQPALSELKRMKRQFNWDNATYQSSSVRDAFRRALVLQFNLTYGTDQNNLASWQNLCRAMRLTNIPDELSKCKKLVETVYVNLIDLVDMPNTGRPARLFKNERKLSYYTKRTDKFFPRRDARAGGLLKHLLRQILDPRRQGETKAKTA